MISARLPIRKIVKISMLLSEASEKTPEDGHRKISIVESIARKAMINPITFGSRAAALTSRTKIGLPVIMLLPMFS